MTIYLIIASIALVLILEGILPFIAPRFWRRMVLSVAGQKDRVLRLMGLGLMLMGLLILILAHQLS